MTKAEKMREITVKAMENKREENEERNRKYANRLANTRIYKRASKGFNNCEIKVNRFYNPTIVIGAFEKMGFEVKRASKNGKAILTVKW